MSGTEENKSTKLKNLNADFPRINLRPFLFIALGLIFGIILYTRIRFGGAKGTDFIFFVLLLAMSVRPFSLKRIGTIFLCFFVAAGVGAGFIHWKCESFLSGVPAGEYEVAGTVVSFTVEDGSSSLLLNGLSLNGVSADGKLSVSVPSESIRTGDRISFSASVTRGGLPKDGSSYAESLFIKDIRYFATLTEEGFAVTGKGNALLRLNGSVYNVLHGHLSKTQADTAYALLTGNAGNMDDGFATKVRQGGVAHIFAVSGLHIGILYAAVSFAFKKLKRFRVLPALAAVVTYSAFCGFSVSSVRAVIMCAVLGIYNALGRKYDFLGAIAFAASAVLFVRPAEWLSAGFRLSFGACLGLALYSRTIKRLFKKLPRFLSEYLAANLAVQIFTFPVLFETFGYFSIWGTVLNFFLIPALPVLFLGLFLAVIFALLIPPAAAVFLSIPNGMLTLFLWIFSFDFSLVLTGFSLGAGGAVWTIGAVVLSERVRFGGKTRVLLTALCTSVFMLAVLFENAVFTGCKLIATKGAVLAVTRTEHVLIIDGSLSASSYENFLMRNYDGRLDAVVVLNQNAGAGLSVSLALPAEEVRASNKTSTGLSETGVLYDREFHYGNLYFRFEGESKLTLVAEGSIVEIDFTDGESLSADLFLGDGSANVYYLRRGAVYSSY
ncbi:MAG: ComEC/Rec2 family competence protein [Clostridia bacterium]|nr:ComEC/Rec2 family competence protein [Clostridia bacterium]